MKCSSMCMYMNPLNYVTNLWRFLTSIHFISDAKIKKRIENLPTYYLRSL